jgi:integrase
MGSLYRKRLTSGNTGAVWWMKYYVNGRPIRESTGTRKQTEAKRILAEREGRVATGQPLLPRADKVRYEDAKADLRQHYQATGARDLVEADYRFAHLDQLFAARRLAVIGPADITAYTVARQAEGAANGTIRRELATLSRMLSLAYENGKLLRMPVIRKPKEGPPREGFFERAHYDAVRRKLPPDLQVACDLAHTYGWRMQSEILTRERRHLDLAAGTLRLEAGETKNDDGRVVKLTPELKALLAAQVARVDALGKHLGRIIPYLFPHLTSRRHLGERRRDFRKAWVLACTAAGVPGRLRHDFRRTAVRNMVNLGVPERVAMTVTGHKTRAVFDRYHIVSPADLDEVARKLSAAGHDAARGHPLGTPGGRGLTGGP